METSLRLVLHSGWSVNLSEEQTKNWINRDPAFFLFLFFFFFSLTQCLLGGGSAGRALFAVAIDLLSLFRQPPHPF